MSGYYDRPGGRAPDGSPVFATAADAAAEREIAAALAQVWDCELRPFGSLAPIDWYAARHGRLIGVVELKSRAHATTTHETVWLNVRKWLALTLAGAGLGVTPVFVVRFCDDTRWVDVRRVDARRVRVGGCARRVKSASDVEPVIDVPVADMAPLGVLT